MDRIRGNRGRGGYRGSSSNFSSYNNSNNGGPQRSQNWSRSPNFGNTEGTKRRYDSPQDHHKSYNQHNNMSSGPQDSSYKQFRGDFRGHSERRSNNTNSIRGSSRFRVNFNKNVRGSGGYISHRPARRNEDDHTRRTSEGRGEGGRQYRSASGSASRDRSSWDRNLQHNHLRSKQPQVASMKRHRLDDSSSSSPPKKFRNEESTKELWADVTMSSLANDIEDDYASADEEQSSKGNFPRMDSFSPTRDGENGDDRRDEETVATEGDNRSTQGNEKRRVKEEPQSETEGEPTPDQDCKRNDASKERGPTKGKRKKTSSSQDPPQYFIRLQCPHCHQRSVTFREYIAHLSSQRHAESLRKLSLQHRMSLAKLRTRQRKEQLQIEAQSSRPAHSSRMNFCAICKLYHSESRPNHETTELHKIIKNFLMPYCPICRVNFKSRMLFEKHVATLTHIKNKVNMEKTYERRRNEDRKVDHNDEREDCVLLDLDNFMTLDAVGSVDGDGDGCPSLEEVVIGEEFVKKVEVYYCEICQRYLSRTEPADKVLELHCRTRAHHHAVEEKQRDNIPDDSHADANEGCSETPGTPADSGELKRTASEERLWDEAGKDIGGVCDAADDHDTVAADVEDFVEENNNEENELETLEATDENVDLLSGFARESAANADIQESPSP